MRLLTTSLTFLFDFFLYLQVEEMAEITKCIHKVIITFDHNIPSGDAGFCTCLLSCQEKIVSSIHIFLLFMSPLFLFSFLSRLCFILVQAQRHEMVVIFKVKFIARRQMDHVNCKNGLSGSEILFMTPGTTVLQTSCKATTTCCEIGALAG